ncbi:MAG: hypothetical protein CR986_07915 [Ignavibacteriae bacterium]|nr:MAG: hypothetical protein CR986_07915 [Ignavibacteriota bacterium]
MGNYSLLQIVGSTIIGGLLLLGLFRYNGIMIEKKHSYDTQNIVQKNINEINNLLYLDFSKIGYCLNKNEALKIFEDPIIEATDSTFAFKTDVPIDVANPFGDGTPDIVKYYLGGSLSGTVNPRDKALFRKVNSDAPLELNYGITRLKFNYYDRSGNKLSSPITISSIAVIEYDVTVEDIYGYNYNYITLPDTTYSVQGKTFFMKMNRKNKIAIRNLKKR